MAERYHLQALDALRSSSCSYETTTSVADVHKMQTAVCGHPKGCTNCTTIARIYMEDTSTGFYIQVFENQSRRTRRYRMPEQQMVESRLDFMTVTPVKAFVKVSIKRRLEEMEIRVECLALRDKGYDCGNVRISRYSSARRLFHIVFKPQEEVVRIGVHDLPDFTPDLQSRIFTKFTAHSATETTRNDEASNINYLESPASPRPEITSTDKTASSTHKILEMATTSSMPTGENDKSGAPIEHAQIITTIDFAPGYSTNNSSASTEARRGSTADIFVEKRPTVDSPVRSSNVTKAKGNRFGGTVKQLTTGQIVQPRIETSTFSYIDCDEDEDEYIPLLGFPSRGIVRKKMIASIMRKAENCVRSFLRRALSSTQLQ